MPSGPSDLFGLGPNGWHFCHFLFGSSLALAGLNLEMGPGGNGA